MKQVLVLQHAECEAPGLIGESVEECGCEVKPVRSFAGEAVPEEIGDAAGLVIMGGPMGVYEHDHYPFIRKELRLIEDTLRRSKPLLGVCLGSQLLASALGSEVKKGKQKEIGWHRVTLTEASQQDPLWSGAESSFMACHWHGDVFDLPPSAAGLASSMLTPCQAFRYGTAAYGFLFHMEITPEILRGMTTAFEGEIKEEGIDADLIMRESQEYLPALHKIGRQVFRRWAGLLLGQ
ncbi:MAG TPA: gamma-glutamyl-gamma-aminobutyrate hydrolase family protein [Terriglobia bacterium]|nr:gamma-glutamyl-gamma-aminobutyrate hydrolase family protein [Terriglobia bacterium]